MKDIVYLKQITSYDDVLKKNHNKMPIFFKKLIFLYKNIFNVITKKKIEGYNIWVLPITERYSVGKLNRLFKKVFFNNIENIYLLSNEFRSNQICKILKEYNIEYISESKIKKILLKDILKYICNIQNKELNSLELTVLVNNTSELNMYILEEMAKNVKTLKIVSLNIYKFKKFEEKIYNEHGIAIQFSNSYRKSLEKSKLIINLDFSELEINEYEIYHSAIIINCIENSIKIKSRLFNGILINSCNIEFSKCIVNKFKKLNIYDSYDKLLLYASIIENEKNIYKIIEQLEKDKVSIISLVGNNGNINKREFKNVDKKLDKNIKKE